MSDSQTGPADGEPRARRWVQRNDTRVRKVVELLEQRLGVPERRENRDGLQVLVVTVLSQNTTDPNALQAYLNLLEQFPSPEQKRRYPERLPRDEEGNIDAVKIRMSQAADALPSPDWEAVRAASRDQIEESISVCGLQQSKAATIQRILDWLHEQVGEYRLEPLLEDKSPTEAAELLSAVKGIGVKTAAVTLMEADGVDLCPVDTHVHRVCQRLRLVEPSSSRNKTFRELQPLVPDGKGHSLHHNLLTFGRTICTARNPDCEHCYLNRICHYYRNETLGEDMRLKFTGTH